MVRRSLTLAAVVAVATTLACGGDPTQMDQESLDSAEFELASAFRQTHTNETIVEQSPESHCPLYAPHSHTIVMNGHTSGNFRSSGSSHVNMNVHGTISMVADGDPSNAFSGNYTLTFIGNANKQNYVERLINPITLTGPDGSKTHLQFKISYQVTPKGVEKFRIMEVCN